MGICFISHCGNTISYKLESLWLFIVFECLEFFVLFNFMSFIMYMEYVSSCLCGGQFQES
jgi:hypothetical protein